MQSLCAAAKPLTPLKSGLGSNGARLSDNPPLVSRPGCDCASVQAIDWRFWSRPMPFKPSSPLSTSLDVCCSSLPSARLRLRERADEQRAPGAAARRSDLGRCSVGVSARRAAAHAGAASCRFVPPSRFGAALAWLLQMCTLSYYLYIERRSADALDLSACPEYPLWCASSLALS